MHHLNHLFQIKRPPRKEWASNRNRLVILILALLIRDAAAGLARRLAGGLAFTAAAVLYALGKIAGFESVDSFHNNISSNSFIIVLYDALYHLSSVSAENSYAGYTVDSSDCIRIDCIVCIDDHIKAFLHAGSGTYFILQDCFN